MGHQDESLLDKVKNALGMGGDESHDHPASAHESHDHPASAEPSRGTGQTDEGSGLGRNPGPVGSAEYEGGATPADFAAPDRDADGTLDTTREDAAATQHGGAYGHDDTPMPTSAAWDRGEAPPEGSGLEGDEDREEPRERGL